MPARNPFPKKKSHLSPSEKALVAAHAFHLAVSEGMEPDEIGLLLRTEVGVQWTLLSAIQYLTGKAAVASVLALPSNFTFRGLNKQQLVALVDMANDCAANVRPDGTPLTAGPYLKYFKRPT